MTKSFKKNLSLLWFVPLLMVFNCGCGGDSSKSTYTTPSEPLVKRFVPKEDFVHKASGMTFGQKVGDFTIQQVTIYDRAGENISVKYTSEFMGFTSAVIEVYIYNAQADISSDRLSLQQEFDRQKGLLLNIFPSAYQSEQGNIKIGQPFGPQNGLMLRLKRKPNDVFKKKDCFEKLYLFEHGKWFIKYRITNPVNNEKQISKTAGTFMQLLQWPQLNQNTD